VAEKVQELTIEAALENVFHALPRAYNEAQLDATSTTWLVDQLEQASLIKRKHNDTDRRSVPGFLDRNN
jgi:DNA-binding MarR family transcriptional regulator